MTSSAHLGRPAAGYSSSYESVGIFGGWRGGTTLRRNGHGPCFLYSASRSLPGQSGFREVSRSCPGGVSDGGTSGGGGSSWAGCVCRGPASTAQRGFCFSPRHAGMGCQREENGCSRHRGMRKSPSAGNFCVSMHARRPPATTNLRGGASGVRQRPPTRDSCRTLPPRAPRPFAPSHTPKIVADLPSSLSARRDASHAAPIRVYGHNPALARDPNCAEFLDWGLRLHCRTGARREILHARSYRVRARKFHSPGQTR